MKTAISLPDEVFEQAERLARKLNKSRSELYREALAEYVARHSPDAITESMDRALADLGAEAKDAFAPSAGKLRLRRTEW